MSFRPTSLIPALIALAAASFAHAQAPEREAPPGIRPVVVELFSSQSCGNCPTANRNVGELSKRNDIIAMTYPVGYWNYLGWDDTFAKPEFTKRQKDYNRSMGYRGPYTPQVVFGGRLHSSGVKLETIEEGLARRDHTPYPANVRFEPGRAVIDGEYDGEATVMLVRVKPGYTRVTPKSGENEGKPMAYYNLVTSIEEIGKWTGGSASYHARDCNAGCTILVQKDGPTGRIVGVGQRAY